MKIQIENLKAFMSNRYEFSIYQKADAIAEFNKLVAYTEELEQLNLACVVKSEATLPLREFIEAVDEYVYEQENHEIKRTPQRMTTIKCVAHWCKRFAEHLAK